MPSRYARAAYNQPIQRAVTRWFPRAEREQSRHGRAAHPPDRRHLQQLRGPSKRAQPRGNSPRSTHTCMRAAHSRAQTHMSAGVAAADAGPHAHTHTSPEMHARFTPCGCEPRTPRIPRPLSPHGPGRGPCALPCACPVVLAACLLPHGPGLDVMRVSGESRRTVRVWRSALDALSYTRLAIFARHAVKLVEYASCDSRCRPPDVSGDSCCVMHLCGDPRCHFEFEMRCSI